MQVGIRDSCSSHTIVFCANHVSLFDQLVPCGCENVGIDTLGVRTSVGNFLFKCTGSSNCMGAKNALQAFGGDLFSLTVG